MRAAAVSATENAVTRPAPNLSVSRSLSSAEMMVPALIVIEMPPAHDSGACRAPLMVGHAEPSSPSGSPSEMKAK